MAKSALKKWLKTSNAKRLLSVCRWLHIYISTALFSLMLFFCATGITLNHPNWAGASPEQVQELILPENIRQQLQQQNELPLKKIQSFIQQQIGLSEPRNVDVMLNNGEITYDYPLPAGYAFVTVLIDDGVIEIAQKKGSMLAVLNDLHKGRHSGDVWGWLIDISAALMLLFSLTGLIILLQNAKHRRKAFGCLLLGSFTPVALYLLVVPQL